MFERLAAVAAHLDVVEQSASTNAELLAGADRLPHLSVLLTEDQTAGRGRLDRTWVAPAGSALAISVLLRELPGNGERGWIPLIAGVAMADAVAAQLPTHTVGVKWPNDVLVAAEKIDPGRKIGAGRKICGILAEVAPDGAVVVGAGVNTAMTAAQLPVATATSFAVVDAVADVDRLAADFLSGLDALLRELVAGGSDAIRGRVRDACLTLGRHVRVSMPDGSVLHGRAVDLDPDGRLVVDTGGAQHPVAAGDVVHASLA